MIEVDGNYYAHCPDGRWWLSPACRQNVSQCIPVVSVEWGHAVPEFMTNAYLYNMPLAIGVLYGFRPWFDAMVASNRFLCRCWFPTAVDVYWDPQVIAFPNSYSWDGGSQVDKIVSNKLRAQAPKVIWC